MLKAAQTSEKCPKSPFQRTLGMLGIPKHPQVVRVHNAIYEKIVILFGWQFFWQLWYVCYER